MEAEPKRVWRLPPCPAYDVEGMESWLTDQEARGLRLSRDGFFAGFAIFEKRESSTARYRLQPAEKGKSAWNTEDGPSDGEEEMSAAMGWDYVARWGEFHIYRCADRQARELNTDPRVQAIALDKVRSRERMNLISLFFWPVLFLGSVAVCGPLLCLLEIGLWRFLLLAAAAEAQYRGAPEPQKRLAEAGPAALYSVSLLSGVDHRCCGNGGVHLVRCKAGARYDSPLQLHGGHPFPHRLRFGEEPRPGEL